MKRTLFVASLLITPTAMAAPSTTHCQSGEKTAFSCQLNNGKVASICSTGGGKAAYRFGALGKIELTFPSNGPATGWYKFQKRAFAKGFEPLFTFKSGDTEYEVAHHIVIGKPKMGEGEVTITQGNKPLMLVCKAPPVYNWDAAQLVESEDE